MNALYTNKKNPTPLTIAVLRYQQDNIGLENIVNQVVMIVYRFRHQSIPSDDIADFLTYFYDHIPRIVNRYAYFGIPFDHYIISFIRYYLITYTQKQRIKNYYSSVIHTFEMTPTVPSPHSFSQSMIETLLRLVKVSNNILTNAQRNKILILTLKFAVWLSDGHITRIACVTDFNYSYLYMLCEHVRIRLDAKNTRRNEVLEKRNRVYSRLLLQYCQYNNRHYAMHTRSRSQLLQKINTMRKRIITLNRLLANTELFPTNAEVGYYLSIPKGTVDSLLAALRKEYRQW